MVQRRRKKNPSTAQWIVLGVGGAAGLGLLGYGISVALKNRKSEKDLRRGLGATRVSLPGEWLYTIEQTRENRWAATVYQPGGRNPQVLPEYQSFPDASASAKIFIKQRGGTPVYRKLGEIVAHPIVAVPMG